MLAMVVTEKVLCSLQVMSVIGCMEHCCHADMLTLRLRMMDGCGLVKKLMTLKIWHLHQYGSCFDALDRHQFQN